jgi:hypothetical protein
MTLLPIQNYGASSCWEGGRLVRTEREARNISIVRTNTFRRRRFGRRRQRSRQKFAAALNGDQGAQRQNPVDYGRLIS